MTQMPCKDFLMVYCQDDKACVVDVRSRDEYGRKRLPRSNCIPLDELESKFQDLPQDKKVYLMCQSGMRAKKAQETLQNLGMTNVVAVSGGIRAVEKEDKSQLQVFSNTISIMRQVQITAGLLIALGVILSLFINPSFIYLSGFVGVGLMFSGITGTCAMGSLLSKMPWNRVNA